MTWNASLIDGPISIPVLGQPDAETGDREFVGSVSGYHLNVSRGIMTPDLGGYEVTPNPRTPVCVFAGDEPDEFGVYALTAFLSFADEDEAKAALAGLWFEPVAEDLPDPAP